MPMVTMWKSGVYHPLHICHVSAQVKKKVIAIRMFIKLVLHSFYICHLKVSGIYHPV